MVHEGPYHRNSFIQVSIIELQSSVFYSSAKCMENIIKIKTITYLIRLNRTKKCRNVFNCKNRFIETHVPQSCFALMAHGFQRPLLSKKSALKRKRFQIKKILWSIERKENAKKKTKMSYLFF